MDGKPNLGTPAPATDFQAALLSIRQARDSVLAQNHELITRLAKAEEELAVITSERDSMECEREVALKRAEKYMLECDELRRKAISLSEEKFALVQAEEELRTSKNQQISALTEERDALRAQCEDQERMIAELQAGPVQPTNEEAVTELQEAQRTVADLEALAEALKAQHEEQVLALTNQYSGEREQLEAKLSDQISGLEVALNSVREQLRMQESAPPMPSNPDLEAVQTQHRLEIEELAAQLEATRIFNRELCDALDAVRLPAEAVAPEDASASETEIHEYDASGALSAMSNCVEMLHEQPENVDLLGELDGHLRRFAALAAAAGLPAIHRYTVACGDIASWLAKSPGKVSPATLAPLREAMDLLRRLAASSTSARDYDLTDAMVYAVDDDLDNCECIASALEKIDLRTKYASRPEVALADISETPCNLIILDVDMPRMDGFELATRIRQVEQHRETPIIFLSGLVSTKERLAATPIHAAIYMPKPYNLKELGLKVLGKIIESRTALA